MRDTDTGIDHNIDSDITHNPFADSPNGSSLRDPTKQRLVRRKLSERLESVNTNTRSRSRSPTAGGHPLKNDISHNTHSYDDVTRPRLAKIILDPKKTTTDLPDDFVEEESRNESHSIVHVHEVSPDDSLACVSLAYGISMADLRKANQLWVHDSIHLRKLLYIPLDRASKLKHVHLPNDGTTPAHPQVDNLPPLNIHRVPASRLSFFPSTSQTHYEDSSSISAFITSPRRSDNLDPDGSANRGPNSHVDLTQRRAPNISSLFSSIPRVLPHSREVTNSRLSCDSIGTSGTLSSDGLPGQEHEMSELDDNAPRRIPTINNNTGAYPEGNALPSFLPSSLRIRSKTSVFRHSKRNEIHHDDVSLVSPPTAMAVRTSQLEPSPEMHIPILSRKRSTAHSDEFDVVS